MGNTPLSEPSERGTGRNAVREFGSSALLVSAVAAILLTGLALRSEPPAERAVPASELAAPAPRPPEPEAPAEVPAPSEAPAPAPPAAKPPAATAAPASPAVDPEVAALARRATDDLVRIGRARGGWTAQLLVGCKPGTVDRLVRQAGGSSKLYVLPAEVHGAACFRVCWGSYASAAEASSARDLPGSLRGDDPVRAVAIGKVLP